MDRLRALTIRQPWAALIAHDDKRVENRTWGTGWRGQLLIHAAKTADPIERHSDPVTGGEVRSAIVATATLTDCHVCDGGCSLWAEPGRFHWVLADVHALAVPVPCRGALGLWRPGPVVAAAVDAAGGAA